MKIDRLPPTHALADLVHELDEETALFLLDIVQSYTNGQLYSITATTMRGNLTTTQMLDLYE